MGWTITLEGSSTPSCQRGDTSCCFTAGTYTISCTDSYGDGWNGHKLFVGEVQKCDPFNAGNGAADELIVTGFEGNSFHLTILLPYCVKTGENN